MSGKHRRGGPVDADLALPEELFGQPDEDAAEVASEPAGEPVAETPTEPPTQTPAAQQDDDRLTPVFAPAGVDLSLAVLPAGASARRAVRVERRRQARRTRVVAGVAAGVLLLVALVGAVKILGGGDGSGPASGPSSARTQTTLLMQVVDDNRQTVGAVLLGHDTRSGDGAGVLVPSALVVDVPGSGSAAFGATSAAGPAGSSALALGDALGVTVDGTWVLDAAGLAALVDAVGGVDVTVDRDVTVTGAGGSSVVATAGRQHLDGAGAAAYATFLAPQEAEQVRLARFSTVLEALLPKLPGDDAGRSKVLGALGSHSASTLSPSRLQTVLGGLRSDAAGQQLAFDTLPTRALDPGAGGAPTLLLDPVAAAQMVGTDFAGSRLPQRSEGPVRVLVQNGVGTPGLASAARSRLVAAGLAYVNGGNAAHFGFPRSYVLILDATAASRRQGAAVAKALGLPAADVAVTDQGQSVADVVVVLGADFKP